MVSASYADISHNSLSDLENVCSYQDLAIEARDIWLSWNEHIANASPSQLPAGLAPDDKLLFVCGSYFLAEGSELRDFYRDSLDTMERTAPDFRKKQFVRVLRLILPCFSMSNNI